MNPALAAAIPGAVVGGLDLIGSIVSFGRQLSAGAITLGQYRTLVANAYAHFDQTIGNLDAQVGAIFAEAEALADALPETNPDVAPVVVPPVVVPPAAPVVVPPAAPVVVPPAAPVVVPPAAPVVVPPAEAAPTADVPPTTSPAPAEPSAP